MSDRITWDELQAALAAAEPAAVLLAPRFLRRIIRRDRELPGLGLHVPHRKCYVIERDRARAMVRADEAAELHRADLPSTVELLAGPMGRRWRDLSKPDVLASYSRRLFHARIDLHLKLQWTPAAPRAVVRSRIAEIGQAPFDEIRAVLRDEQFVFPPFDDAQVYAEFCAVYLELERYAPDLIEQYFPSLPSPSSIGALIRRDVPADEIFEACRLPGARAIAVRPAVGHEAGDEESQSARPFDPWDAPSLQRIGAKPMRYRYYRARALRAARRGNDARCILQNIAAYRVAPLRFAEEARNAADEAVLRLAERLAKGVRFMDAGDQDLKRLLPMLLPSAIEGFWNQSAKLLYDLQSACVDLERGHFAVDVWSWLFSLCRTPIRRPLPMLPEVLAARRLRSALRRIRHVPLRKEIREQWRQLLQIAADAAGRAVREKFEPPLDAELHANGFEPTSAVERVAVDKIIAELLDAVVAQGRFSLGDLRDAVARNDFKLPDVQNFGDFRRGDALLRANRALARAFDGVYRGGEFYSRWLLQFTSLAYGTRAGRFITRHFGLPIGGAILVVEGLQHTLFVLVKHAMHAPEEIHFANPGSISVAAIVIYAWLHSEAFAAQMRQVGRWTGRALWRVFVEWPSRLLQWPSIQRFLNSAAFVVLRRAVIYPVAIAYAVVELGPAFANTFVHVFWPHTEFELDFPQPPGFYLGVAFVCAATVFISPLGRRIEHVVSEQLAMTWRRIRFDLLPGLIRGVMEFFRWMLDGLERLLYAVDERLRFHAGESRSSLIVKTSVGAIWLVIENIVRAIVTLTIEPQVNPIKHFPVVTVSHKIMLPMVPALADALKPLLGTEAAALTTAGVMLSMMAGVCGFLAWELLTNWRLYEATRPETLRPRPFGSHGETMVRMLRPGFHSGTVPKLFSKLRRARRAEYRSGDSARVERLRDDLHHTADAVEQFVRRELLRLLREHPAWRETPCVADHIMLASNRIVVAILCPALGDAPLKFTFEEQSGWLAAGIVDAGWLRAASHEQRESFEWALAGFYKRCSVAISREQLEGVLADVVPNIDAYDIADVGLVVWPSDPEEPEIVYSLASEVDSAPPSPPDAPAKPLPLRSALFARVDLTWVRWAYYWNAAAEAGPLPWRLLPADVPDLTIAPPA